MSATEMLRRRAEALLEERRRAAGDGDGGSEAEDLLEEITVAHAELEVQADELRETQSALELARRHYAELFLSAPLPFALLTGDGVVAEMNARATALLGHQLGHRLAECFPGIPQSDVDSALLVARRDGRHVTEWTARRSGAPQHLQIHLSRRGGTDDVILSLVDITALRSAESAARQSAAKLDAIVAASRDGLIVCDVRYRIVRRANPAFLRMLGREEAVIGLPLARLLAQDTLPLADLMLSEQLRQPGLPFTLRFEGSEGPLELEAVASRIEDGGEPMATLVLRDERERRRLETERAALHDRALHVQKLEALGRVAAGVAHDMNNTLAVITNALAVMELDTQPGLEQELADIGAATSRARRLTSSLLDYGRLEVTKKIHFDVRELLERTLVLARAGWPKSARFEERLGSASLYVEGDPGALQQAVINLVLNARDAVSEHGLLVVSLEPRGDDLVLAVSDDGVGIAEGDLERVFEPFFTTKPIGKGTGLGLSQVWSTIKAHGGRTEIDSRLGEGTVVRLVLPRAPDAPTEKPPPPARTDGPLHGLRVLVVDDEPLVLRSEARLFERFGAKVVTAGDVASAVPLIGGVDLVVCDYAMPGQSGEVLLRQTRAQRPSLPFIVASGFLDEPTREVLEEGGVSGLLEKPFNLSELLQLVAKLDVRPVATTPSETPLEHA